MTFRRLTGKSQQEFNDEIFEAASKFITWDLRRVEKVANKYANQHSAKLSPVEGGWFKIDSVNCPQNYGYNGIQLTVPEPGTDVSLGFLGIAGAQGYSNVKTQKAGWRYGFLAYKKDGSRVYGKMSSATPGKGYIHSACRHTEPVVGCQWSTYGTLASTVWKTEKSDHRRAVALPN